MATMTQLQREALYGSIIREQFRCRGLPASWGMAIATHENPEFDPKFVNNKGGDAKLGNAWGLCQMTYATAVGLGYAGRPEGLCDPTINASLAAQLFLRNKAALNTMDFATLAAAYNCGVNHVKSDTIPAITHDKYVPAVLRLQAHYAHYDTEPT